MRRNIMKLTPLRVIYMIILLFLFFVGAVILRYTLPILFNLIGLGIQHIWIGYAIILLIGLWSVFSFVKRHSIFVGTNEALVVQGFENGFYSSGGEKRVKLGKVFFYWPKFVFKSITKIYLSTQVIPLKRIEDSQEVDVAVTTKDGMLVKVVGSFEFQVTGVMLYYDKIFEYGMNWDKSLVKAGNLLSRILETYIERVVSESYDLEDLDRNKKKISEESLQELQAKGKLTEDEFAEYGVRVVRLHITDFCGDDIISFRKNEASIQDQENKLALSDEEKKTQLGILANKQEVLAKENEVIDAERKVAEAKAEMERALKIIQAKGLAEALKIDLEAKSAFSDIFKYTNSLTAIIDVIKADATRYPQLTSLIGGDDGLEKLVGVFKTFQQAINQ